MFKYDMVTLPMFRNQVGITKIKNYVVWITVGKVVVKLIHIGLVYL